MIDAANQPINIIVAVDLDGGFAKNGKIPWNIPEDFKHFKQVTDGGVCIMGRGTYIDMVNMMETRGVVIGEDILPGRQSFVVTTNKDLVLSGVTTVGSINDAITALPNNNERAIFLLGGRRLFIEGLARHRCSVHMTIIKSTFECDQQFPIAALDKYTIINGYETPLCYFVNYQYIPGN